MLALDSSMGACAAAVLVGDQVAASRILPMQRGHAEALAPLLAEVMAEAGIGFDTLERIVAGRGPGSFTGVRIGLAAARGLALALDIPALGIDTTAALAASVPPEWANHRRLALIRSGRGDFYVQPFGRDGTALHPAAVMSPATLSRLAWDGVRVGDAPDVHIALSCPDPVALARLGRTLDPAAHPPDPLYLRPPATTS